VGLSQRPPIELPAITLPAIPLPVLFGVSSTPRPALPTAATATRTATQAPTDTPTLVAPPTRSQPDLPLTVTPARMLPTGFLTPVKALSTPLPDAHFGKIVLASAISGEGYPTVITDTYRTGRFTIYAVFTYTHMSPGVAWGQVWLRGTTPVRGELALWSLKSDGHAYVFINPTEGWLPGDYEVQLYIDRRIEQFAGFRVLP
jgi:hypothetical protein